MGRGERGGAEAIAAADGAEREGQRRSNSSCRWGGAKGAAPNKEQLPMGRGEKGSA
jgi:hypothetical protein